MNKCKGCNVIAKESCFFIAVKEIEQCPCVNCLVMVMCDSKKRCDKRNDIAGQVSIAIAKEIINRTPNIWEI